MENRNELKLDLVLNIVGILTAINEQSREKGGEDKYNVHKFIKTVRAGEMEFNDLVLLNRKVRDELSELMGFGSKAPSFEEVLEQLKEMLGIDDEDADEEDIEDDGCDCSNCSVKGDCPSYDDEDEEDEEETREEAKKFAEMVEKLAEEHGFVLTEIGIGKVH